MWCFVLRGARWTETEKREKLQINLKNFALLLTRFGADTVCMYLSENVKRVCSVFFSLGKVKYFPQID